MGWAREHLVAFHTAVGLRRFLLVPIFGLVVAGADLVSRKLVEVGLGSLIGVPSWAVGVYAATLLVAFCLLGYIVKLRRQIYGTRVRLSTLRSEGVTIRNRGQVFFSTQGEFEDWSKQVLDWNDRIIREIRDINEADAEWFAVLDVVKPPRLPMVVSPLSETSIAIMWLDEQRKHYWEHDFRLRRLGKMIQNLWRE